MTDTIIKHSSQFLPEARQLKRFLNPIINCLNRQADELEYALWRVRDYQQTPTSYWNTMELLAGCKGWRVIGVHHRNDLEFIVFHPAANKHLVIHKYLGDDRSLEVVEQNRLSATLLVYGFSLVKEDEHSLFYEKNRQGASLPKERNDRVLFENPFPEARTFLKSERAETYWLKHFAKLIEEQGEEHGYVVEFFNDNKGNDQLALVEPTLRKAGWLVTKVMEGEDLDFVLLTPVAVLQLDIRTAWYGNVTLKEDEQDRLIEALKLQNYLLTERDAHYLSFTLSRSTRN